MWEAPGPSRACAGKGMQPVQRSGVRGGAGVCVAGWGNVRSCPRWTPPSSLAGWLGMTGPYGESQISQSEAGIAEG